MCVYYVKSVNMSRSLLFHVFIYVCTMLRVLICQGVYFSCVYIYMCVCTMLRVLICQGAYYFLYMCVYYVKSVNMSRSLLFHVFIYVCTLQKIFVIFTNSLVDIIKIKFSIQLNES